MDINIRITGEAGQGIAGAAAVLGKVITRSGCFAFSYNDAESRVRGGLNFNHIRVSTGVKRGVTDRVDILLAFSQRGFETYGSLLTERGVVFAAEDWGVDGERVLVADLEQKAVKAGSPKVMGTVGIAVVCGLLGLKREVLESVVEEQYGSKQNILDVNLKGVDAGYDIGEGIKNGDLKKRGWDENCLSKGDGVEESTSKRMWMRGAQVVAGGALAGGVGFMAAYPMSPSTGIITTLAGWAEEFGVTVVQAEDEIAAINMVAGAAYGGARSMTATSGGGFALMEEGVSLLGMIEYPAVIVVAQRPGPATGMPTRQAQGDLHMVLNAGHGHFPRVVVAPRDFEEGFVAVARAFDLAERFQVPVFVLTDQHLQDGQGTIETFSSGDLEAVRHFLRGSELEKMKCYRRYELTSTGISPMAPPGGSEHLVVADSDEHDEEGHLTESAETAQAMMEKRLKKEAHLAKEMEEFGFEPFCEGDAEENNLVLSWGSTWWSVREALDVLKTKEGGTGSSLAHVHLSWLWPPPRRTLNKMIQAASRVVVVENNTDGQLVKYIRMVTGREADAQIKRMDGRPFTVEELVEKIGKEAA